LKYALQPKIAKKTTKTILLGAQAYPSFIDVDKTKKPDTSACYDKQHVSIYLQPFSD